MGRMFNPENDTYVYDQCCRNCRWWNPDPVTDKMKCRNCRSEHKGKERADGDGWCWCWQYKGGHRT